MTWIDTYVFEEPLADLRTDDANAARLAEELLREVAPGHTLDGKAVRVVARAWPNDDVLIVCGDEVAVVHLTWIGKQDRPPWPEVAPLGSARDLDLHLAGYDWER
jgi:hypothetical protein